ncbi:flagellar FliL protein [Actinoplanes sp. SE50]|uniref:flagellar basal body-associated FliL family protein n=1 Tax=unclassified Actinoplanes TaxID=2626549 RepID=UPI00023EC9A3|nr:MULTISPECIES: flagellar basal body-associated FliL family protein [unclassified Actinoplanes]AEV85381.1 flagellar FliL protein [Actinoplanes sp. SE50/110]ATO83776.1 flagellar FliL protein [Actinoplanes sp. SE50]SLM01184.1 flagellar FliL protein [Actinoplanes sp. SE50/110]
MTTDDDSKGFVPPQPIEFAGAVPWTPPAGFAGPVPARAGAGRGRSAVFAGAGLLAGLIAGVGLAVGPLHDPLASLSSKASSESPRPTAAPSGRGPVVPLGDALTLNLADGHYLKLGIALQLAAGQPDSLDVNKALELAVDNYTGQDLGELSTAQGRARLKQQLLEKTQAAYPGVVSDLYFVQFVTQ